jgi:hypothetical protein
METATIIISSVAIVLSVISLIGSFAAVAMVCGFLRSTHQVKFVPFDEKVDDTVKKEKEYPIDDLEPLEQEISW